MAPRLYTMDDVEKLMFRRDRRRWERIFTLGGVDENGDFLDRDGTKRNISELKELNP